MRTAIHRTVLAGVVLAGTLALPGVALADDSAHAHGVGPGSSGPLSGNNTQIPIVFPTNPCNQPGGVVGFSPGSGSRCVGH